METDIQKEIKRLQNLKQNKNKSLSDLEQTARLSCWKKQLNITSKFKDTEEKKIAEDLVNNYLDNYTFENFHQITLLGNLVYNELLLKRVRDDINAISADENNKYISDKLIQSLHSIEDRVEQLKIQLGIAKANEKKDDLSALQQLEKRFDIYIPFHRNEFTTVAPCCGKVLLLRRRCSNDKFENLIHPFFSGRFYFNRRGIELVKAGIWTKEQYAWVFFTSPQFVDWCILNENRIVEIDGIEQAKIEEFVKNNPYLKETHVPAKLLQ